MSQRFQLIADGLDIGPLVKKLDGQPKLWLEHIERQQYSGSAHRDTQTIYLRWAPDHSIAGGFYCLELEDYFITIGKLGPAIYDLCATILTHIIPDRNAHRTVDIGRAILTKLKPGGVIAEHVDEGPYADRYDRFHLVLSGSCLFQVEDVAWRFTAGQLFWFNHKLRHTVFNDGGTDRIHLILDVVAPEYRKLRGLTFQRERPHELLIEAESLFQAHYREVAHYQDIPLEINERAYCQLEEAGILRAFTARYNGELVGYCVFMVKPNLRYATSLQAVQDILFVDQSKRGALIGKRLLDFCEKQLKAEGVQVVYQHAKIKSSVGQFFEAVGYELIDGVYGKRLDR